MLPGRSVDIMLVNPVFKFAGTSPSTGILALNDAFASLALRRFLSIPSFIKREDDWA
jgi:hypothetical protein